MLTRDERIAARLGGLMIWGAFFGVGTSCLAVVLLALAGRPLSPWPLVPTGWWAGPDWWLELLAGAGLLALAATPLAMLVVFCVLAVQTRRWRTVAAAVGLGLVLTVGLVLATRGA